MKIAAYEVRPDEKPVIENLCKEYGIDLISTPANLDKTTASMAAGCDGVTTLGQSDYCNEVLDELKGYGVKVLASRCVGYNHMNCDYARSLGFRLCNGAYAPNGVAEYTVMAILMCIRKFKKALYNTNDNDFTLKGKMGRELRTMTVGVMGTGKIGFTVIKCLSGFGCRIIANDVYENDAVRAYAEYVDLDTLYRESDIITIHTPLLPETTGMIDREAIRLCLVATRIDRAVLLLTFAATLILDLERAIFVGVLLSLILYIYKTSHPRVLRLRPNDPLLRNAPPDMPPGVAVYVIEGTLFFGAIHELERQLEEVDREPARLVLLHLTRVFWLDASGAHALEQFVERCYARSLPVILVVGGRNVRDILRRTGILDHLSSGFVADSMDQGLQLASGLLQRITCRGDVCDLPPAGQPQATSGPSSNLR